MRSDRFPLLNNLYVGQVLYGALVAYLGVRAWEAWQAGGLSRGEFMLVVGIVVATFAFLIYLNNIYRHGLVPDYSEDCPYCGAPVNRYSEFCEHCGGDLMYEVQVINCPKCEAEVYEGTPYCPECGKRLPKPKGPPKERQRG